MEIKEHLCMKVEEHVHVYVLNCNRYNTDYMTMLKYHEGKVYYLSE